MKPFVFFLINVIVLALLLGFYFYNNYQKQSLAAQNGLEVPMTSIINPSPIPSVIPFADMTVPFLRQREFSSTLSPLQKVSESATYTSYLTSYNSDGFKINALMTQPKGEMPAGGWPAVVFVHGYIPPKQYKTLEKYTEYVDFLARNGLVVFKIDLRGHGTSEGEASGGYYSSDYVIDTLNARAALQSESTGVNFVNPEKIGLWGHSMAGNILMRALASSPNIPAVVIWGGAGFTYTDLADYGITDNSYQPLPSTSESVSKRQQLFAAYGSFNKDHQFWKQVIPTNYLSEVKGAIQLNHASDDSVVDVRYSRNLNNILDQTDISHEYYELPSGDHNITGASFIPAMQKTVEFYKKHL